MSLFAAYLKEIEDFSVLSNEHAFLTYRKQVDGSYYIRDIYVHPDFRKSGVASELADQVIEMAKKDGAKKLVGSVAILGHELGWADRSIKVLHGYKMKFIGLDDKKELLIFEREL